ncbi:MAG: peptidylprolyl isomerase [Kangiellaceae bacterium]|nr:peptidylprolyl isomerase [Kangiellaceae bacterium]MCW8999344.1 peptidylprolyl isomerase [Kangiellaceae bacterium]
MNILGKNKILVVVLMASLLSACQKETDTPSENQTQSKNTQLNTENSLVTVNGESISEQDLDAAIIRTVGEMGAFQLDSKGRKKVLESIVLSKIMAQKQMASYSPEQQREIERQVQAYKTELLAKNYLKSNVTAVPVTNKMVEEYYAANPHKFGGKTIKQYQVLKGLTKLQGKVRENLLARMKNITSQKDWFASVNQAKTEGFQLEFSTGVSGAQSLNKKVESLIAGLNKDEISSLHYLNGYPMYFKVVAEKVIKPKPLTEVRSDIRKSLAPIQLKRAVRKISDELLKEANVEYVDSSVKE